MLIARSAGIAVLVLVLGLTACGEQRAADGSDGAAVAACRSALVEVGSADRLATTVRASAGGFTVSAWEDGRAEGEPDHLCTVRRDEGAERGVAVVRIRTQDGSGGYRSTLDIELDDAG